MNTLPHDRPRVLIVDDQPNWLEALCDMLDPTLYEIETATNYDEAKSKLKQRAFHVVVTDQRLVDDEEYNIEGILLLDEVAKLRDGTETIVVTGYPTIETVKEALRGRDAFDYILKQPEEDEPFNIRGYRECVKEAAGEAMGARQSKITKDLSAEVLVVDLTCDQIAGTLFYGGDTIPSDAGKSVEKVLSRLLYPLQPVARQMGRDWLSKSDQTCEILCWSRNHGKAALVRIGREQRSLEIKVKRFTEESQYLLEKKERDVSAPVAGVSYIIDEMTFEDFAVLVKEN